MSTDPLYSSERVKQQRQSYSHRDIKDDDFGMWRVYGEDPNPDFGGSHREPLLAVVRGKFIDVFNWGVAQKGWYSWGGGGRIVKAKPEEVVDLSTVPDPIDFGPGTLVDIDSDEGRQLLIDAINMGSERYPKSWAGPKVGKAVVDSLITAYKDRKRFLKQAVLLKKD